MKRVAGVIRTPDQRLRVFVSSTLKELAPERRAARAAIERLALAPVMFELGARPHPPRDVYRAYLDQSDIFVGIYCEQYGWVAPGEQVSGVEDEYDLAPDIPKLIYIKRSDARQERLAVLLQRIREDDGASYVAFADADELARLVTEDLATLLAERFDATDLRRDPLAEPTPSVASTQMVGLPSPRTPLRGRDHEVETVTRMLTTEGQRLVTITGPGGIGKSRLAVAAARAAEASFPDGIAFVDLARVEAVDLVMMAVANALGIRDPGERSLDDVVRTSVGDRSMLLLLDNVEHVVGAAPILGALLDGTAASILATSQIPLRVSGEVLVELGTLARDEATAVFIERAQSAKPGFVQNSENAESIAAIVSALDGVPLALELAAARMQVMTPAAMVDRLDHTLPLLAGGARDLPERQRTIRSTIEWSAQLLHEDARRLLLRLGIFRSGFALEAATWMSKDLDPTDALDAVSALVEGNLIREQDHGQRTWYTMPATVREFALEELEAGGSLPEVRETHAQFYRELAARAGRALTTPDQHLWMPRLVDERDELRAAVEHFLDTDQMDEAAECIWPLLWFWWAGAQLGEVRGWAGRMLSTETSLSDRSRAIATFYACTVASWQTPRRLSVRRPLERAAKTFRREGDKFGEAVVLVGLCIAKVSGKPPDLFGAQRHANRCRALMEECDDPFGRGVACSMLGFLSMIRRDYTGARRRFEEALALARSISDQLGESIAMYNLGWVLVFTTDFAGARERFVKQLEISSRIGSEGGVAFALEGLFADAVGMGDIVTAGRYFGAAEVLRERKGMFWRADFSFHERILQSVRSGPDAARFEDARVAGREAELDDVVGSALSLLALA
jgi:predicted ATPase